jgi:hypothetical protein
MSVYWPSSSTTINEDKKATLADAAYCIPMPRRVAMLITSQFVITSLFADAAFGSVEDPRQHGWRFCANCFLMFRGPDRAGACPAGGQHQPAGYQFAIHKRLTEDMLKEPARPQDKWRRCKNCSSLFYNGFQQKGTCSAGGTHVMDSATQLFLSHDRLPERNEQPEWRFCKKCQALFFDGYAKKGVCAGGGEHEKAGFFFLIPYV